MNEQIKDTTFEDLEAFAIGPIHANTHNHALVHNPFAWDEDEAEA